MSVPFLICLYPASKRREKFHKSMLQPVVFVIVSHTVCIGTIFA